MYRSPLTDLPVFWGGGQRHERFDLDPEAVVPQPTTASGTWSLTGNVLSLAADAQGVWAVVAGGMVWSWEASGGATRSVGVSGAREVVLSGSRALVLDGSSVVPVTRSNGQVGSAISLGAEPGPALVDAAGMAWIALKDSPTVKRIAAGQSSATTISVAAPVTCWAEAKSKVWGGMASTSQVQALSLDGTVGATLSLPVAPDVAIADGAGQVWLAERVSGRLARLIP